ncbi:MAG: Gfo/Idh/MocA family oxidoreductase [Kiritimatiellae bacterium]|nr:Gfo/Idh/MocA family oxidoreductase [Kiritimatiellia bacterium]MDD5521060.1 Gfo/Idh/MocA family oxidoreductase [Kiritimatiellia bacterium]
MPEVKYAIIGFGGIAENRIAKEGFACDKSRFKPLPGVELVGVTDVNSGRKAAAGALGLKWYDSAQAVFADPEIQAVFIATNNLTHAKIARAALLAGKHCIIEKPIATKVDDAIELSKLAREKNLSLTVDHMMTENAFNIKARELVADGALGAVNDSCFHMEFYYGSVPEEAATWRCSSWEELGGPIGDVASHCMYMPEFILGGKIVSIACIYYPKTMPIKVEDGAYIKYVMENGLTGSIKVGFNEPRGGLGGTLSNLGYEIYGANAVLRGYTTMFQLSGHENEPVKIRLELDRFSSQENIRPGKIQNIYQAVILKHANSILKDVPLSGCDAVHNLKLIAAAHESARNGGKIIKVN